MIVLSELLGSTTRQTLKLFRIAKTMVIKRGSLFVWNARLTSIL